MQQVKKRIFIGSSSEELTLAGIAKTVLEKDFDVTIWNDNVWDTSVFKINQNFLSDLLKASLQYDFGVLLGTTDDKVIYRDKELLQPRDNVLFELGLFTGRLGLSKCAFIIEKELKVMSDLSGISLARFEKGDLKGFISAVEQVRDLFLSSRDTEINFFPSATLASVYFENLVVPICKHVIENDGFDLGEIKYNKCILNIVIPEKISLDVNIQFEKMKRGVEMENVSFKYAGRPRYISIETKIKDNVLEFVDFPTIIAGINHAIQNLLPADFNSMSPDYESILDRELKRFITTLKTLLLRHGFDEMVCIKRDMVSSKE
ncbi:CBASS system CD-NTase-associated NAD(+) hydrolase Cap12 [Hymenobacter latericus]|uniref:CBASS system CD-NTase-associated NAD(+) hydrolase Cap12 n=1 Tax=Hymenobacter sp. YIM 151858-1 TaxID=2987688 RepID=UPI002226A8A5|nr:nucleotide-binding protein [Hymenobacter sp. YIM 151858-1]UYZ59751.1 nucleotide-binding protein [Hymenobacter sp. YIM 151858-1]